MNKILDNISLNNDEVILQIVGNDDYFKMGTQLEVKVSYRAAIVKDNKIFDLFGPGKYIFSKKRIPKITEYLELNNYDLSEFEAAIIYINREQIEDLKWGFKINIENYSIQAFGTFEIKIVQILYFIKTVIFKKEINNNEELFDFFREIIETSIKSYFKENFIQIKNNDFDKEFIKENGIDLIEDNFREYGIILKNFNIIRIRSNKIEESDKVKEKQEKSLNLKKNSSKVYEEEKLNLGADLKDIFPSMSEVDGEESYLVCTNCNEKISSDYKYCPFCGTKVELSKRKRKCPHCHSLVDNDSKYCSNCGELLEESHE